MADHSETRSEQLVENDVINDRDIQARLSDGTLQFHDNTDASGGYVNPSFAESSTDPTPEVVRSVPNTNGLPPVRLPPPPSKKDLQRQNKTRTDGQLSFTPGSSTLPVVYDNRSGNDVVIQEPVVVNQPDGSRAIQTLNIPERWRDLNRPLRQKQMNILRVFGVIAILFFFPSGIPACYYAFKAKTELQEGIMRGNIDTAIKYAKRAERLIVLSGILALVFGILGLALAERSINPDRYVNWNPSGTIVGS